MVYYSVEDQLNEYIKVRIKVNGGEVTTYHYVVPSSMCSDRLMNEIAASVVNACTCGDDEYWLDLHATGNLRFERIRERKLVSRMVRYVS